MAPTSQSHQFKNSAPNLIYSPNYDGSVRVRHREYIVDLITEVISAYEVFKLEINPGLASMFPWLSNLAQMYESYLFNNLRFIYESTSTTSDRGMVMLAVDYDASDIPPATKQEFMSYSGSVRSNVWTHCAFSCEQSDLRKFGSQRYVRSGAVVGDIKTFDVGNFYMGNQGITAAQLAVGELYVEYDITLYTPQTSFASQVAARSLHSSSTIGVNVNASFGTSNPTILKGGLLTERRNNTTLWLRFTGQFIMELLVTGTGLDQSDTYNLVLHPAGQGALSTADGWFVNSSGTRARQVAIFFTTSSLNQYLELTFSGVSTVTETTIRFAPYAYLNG